MCKVDMTAEIQTECRKHYDHQRRTCRDGADKKDDNQTVCVKCGLLNYKRGCLHQH